jgi:hypothetical protein
MAFVPSTARFRMSGWSFSPQIFLGESGPIVGVGFGEKR